MVISCLLLFCATLIVNKLESTDKVKVIINSYPEADIGGPYEGVANDNIKFDASKSKDLDGEIKDYLWDFGDGNTSTDVNPSHIYAAAGDYDVTLYAYNDCGMDEYTVTITITIAPEYLRIWIPTLLKNPIP